MFEKDIVKILTTVVIECSESGLNKSASQFAIELMKDNYKPLIPESYKGKVDKISRKAYKNEEEPIQTTSPCPFCNLEIPDYVLDCHHCHNVIPFCLASGRHVISVELSKCPHCNFPAILSEFISYLNSVTDKNCPMCDEAVDYQLLEKMEDPINYIKTRKIANMEMLEKK
jgi:WD repeat-containing protein 19